MMQRQRGDGQRAGFGDEPDRAGTLGRVAVRAHDLLAAVDVDLDTAAVHEHAQVQQPSSCMGIGSTKGLIHPYMICRPFVLNDCGA